MKTKKRVGLFAVALTALACAFPRTAAADGDIRSIEFYGNPKGEVGVVDSLDKPLVAGDKVQFKIRLANREWLKTDSDHTFLNPWVLRPPEGMAQVDAALPQIGLRVSGGLRFAEIVSWDMAEGDLHHTDLICRYTVQAGDFAMPLKLSNSNGTAPAMEADPLDVTVTPEKSNYYLTQNNLWGFYPKFPTDNNSTNRLEFYFGPEKLPEPQFPTAYTYTESRDYDLSMMNIQIRAVDFDSTYADESTGVWRNLAAGTTTAAPAIPRLTIPGGASGAYTYYVWTTNENVAVMENGTDYQFFGGQTHKVAAVSVSKGDEFAPFTVRAKPGMQGKTFEVFMSDTPTNIYNRSQVLLTNFTVRTMCVVEPPPPSITVVLDPIPSEVTPSTNNYLSVATIDVELSEPYTEDVQVKINPSMKSGSGANVFKYIGLSTEMSGTEAYDGEVTTLTVRAGDTKASQSGNMLYVFANRGNADTAKGIRFTPSLEDATAREFFTGSMTAATLTIKDTLRPVITSPAEGYEYFNIPANTDYDFTITIADAMWEIHGKDAAAGDGKYTVMIDYNNSGSFAAITNLTANANGEITFPYRYIVGGREYVSKYYVVNQDGMASSSKAEARSFKVHVNTAKKVEVTPDHEKKTYCEGETATLTFKFSEPFDYDKDAFIFLVPQDDDARDSVECDAFEYGIPISVGSQEPAESASVTLKDGWKNAAFKYNVVVRSVNDPDDDTAIISVWGSDGVTLYSTNAVPQVLSLSMNNTPVYESGSTMAVQAASGVQNMFEVSAWDESFDVDLEDADFETVVKFWENGAVAKTVTLKGNPYGQKVPYTFTSEGKNKVTVHVYDKDMTSAERLVVDKDPFTVFVETASAPAITLVPYNSTTYFDETSTGASLGLIYVDLTVAPGASLGTGKLDVRIEAERLGADDGNYALPKLNVTNVTFTATQVRNSFFLSDLDGTPMSDSRGFRIRAWVTTNTQSPDETKTWAQYYSPCEDFTIYVSNVDPKIGPGTATTNETPAAINVPQKITYTVKDIETDQKAMSITWTYNGASEFETLDVRNRTITKEVTFTSPGSKTVVLMVQDKDGGMDMREYHFYVEPSKIVEIHPRQPNRLNGARGAVSAFAQNYTGAMGIGDGRVWAGGASAPTEVQGFTHKWSFSPEDLKTTVYARGYKYVDGEGEVDRGNLTPGKDFALDPSGNYHASAGAYGGQYYRYRDLKGKDSYFYCWILDMTGGDSGYTGTHLNGTVQPEIGLGSLGEQQVALPEYDDSAVTYDVTVLEAIFSLEYLPSDNLGDINQDGVPDVYAADTKWKGGILYAAAGYSLEDEDPGDLKELGGWNDDAVTTTSGAELGDYLPSTSSAGSTLIPNVVNWATAGGAFTAFTELRGFDSNLNYRVSDDGFNRNVLGQWVSEPTFSKAEWLAIAAHNGFELNAADEDFDAKIETLKAQIKSNESSWIPENRTDPTVDDTDGDGFPDGYEYYFWYSAAVGKINADGEWERLEGSKFTIKNIAMGEKLTSDEIAAAFNPTSKSADSFATRDMDNDGLTDLEELAMGTNPVNWDTDGDGLSDFFEIMNGMHPISVAEGENGAMNKDGDFMARWDSETTYAIVKLSDGREFALANNGKRFVKLTDEEKGVGELTDYAKTNMFAAISVFRYGKDDAVCVPKFRGGSVTNTVDHLGEPASALPLDPLVWDLGDSAEAEVTVKLDQKIALIHDQVYTQFGFDPRTAWYKDNNGYVAGRWNPANGRKQGDAGLAVNTVAFTALDEYLLLKYRYETNAGTPEGQLVNISDNNTPWSIDHDTQRWAAKRYADVFLQGTTNPNIAFASPEWVSATMGETTFASDVHGADSDKDGVPDGWELYVKHNPNSAAGQDTKDDDEDGLGLASEYAGTDACNAYATCETVIANHPGTVSGWFNKFFPTDPANKDTDGDGLTDAAEGGSWTSAFVYGNKQIGSHTFTFIYGAEEGNKSTDDGSLCIRGGGLNPCSVDTDGDCLPDPWERQFAGVVFTAEGQPQSISLDSGIVSHIRRSDGLAEGAVAVAPYITAGMDGTFGCNYANASVTGDAWSNPDFKDPATGTVRDYDFDHDGLQNFQEYLVQALRHLRYDDCETPLMGQWMPSGSPSSLKFVGFTPMNIMDGETFYQKVKAAGFTATGAWNFRSLGYFDKPPHDWDKAALNTSTEKLLNYDERGFRVMLRPQTLMGGERVPAAGYCSTDPRLWDTDADGMDDFYELFHGLNPLLGDVTGGSIANDVIAQSYEGTLANWFNAWTGFPMIPPADPVYDVIKYPWMMGAPGADADGDGLNNYDETIFANLTNPMPTHTDPTPLWYTDSTMLNKASFTAQYYKMDCDAMVPDFQFYPWPVDGAGWMFSFEENEGYDTDHDGLSDLDEKKLTATSLTDPLNFTDPDRRQALWFPGENSAAVTMTCTPSNTMDTDFDFFRQFTVEAWINPSDVSREQVILERTVSYNANTLSNNVSQLRANFRLGIREDGRLYGQFDTDDAIESGADRSSVFVNGRVPEIGKWTHVALSFNGQSLNLYIDGRQVADQRTSLVPANGIQGVTQLPLPGSATFPAGSDYSYNTKAAVVLGAKVVDDMGLELTKKTTWECYDSFYAGYIDEVRVWDGARTANDIFDSYKTRISVADAQDLRQSVYDAWVNDATRNENDGKLNLPAELVLQYNFQSLPSAADAADVMWEPSGFTKNVLDQVRDADGQEIPGDLYCGWWKQLPVHSTVYNNYRWVPWIQNLMAHLAPMDGSTIDSKYWGLRLAGVCAPTEAGVDQYLFPNTMNPYSKFFGASDVAYYNNRLTLLSRVDSALFGETTKLYRFEQRTTSLGSTDLIPLGGAFAKRCEDMWDGEGASDAWTSTGDDLDGNGIPDWWEALAVSDYDAPEVLDWNSLVNYNGVEMTAREAYLRDLSKGMQPDGSIEVTYMNTIDRDADGLPDWWESMFGIDEQTGKDDYDYDGLCNRAEFIIAECFGPYDYPAVKPTAATSFVGDGQVVPDYFLRVGSLYLGEIFSDHDFMEDEWENKFNPTFVSRAVYDAKADIDNDGWSNYAECRAGTDPTAISVTTIDSEDLPAYPVPVIVAKINYNGNETFRCPIVFKAWSAASAGGMPDAIWTVGEAAETSSSSTSSSSASGEESGNSKIIGKNSNAVVNLHLGPGSVEPGSVKIEFKDTSYVYEIETLKDGAVVNYQAYIGDYETSFWEKVCQDEFLDGGVGNVIRLGTREVVGTINYTTGEAMIDLRKLQDYAASESANEGGVTAGDTRTIYYTDLAESYVKVSWNSRTATDLGSGTFYLADADKSSDTARTRGYVREGKNVIMAFLDKDGNGEWTPGEPMGCAKDVDVGWSRASFEVELTDTTALMARYDLIAGSGVSGEVSDDDDKGGSGEEVSFGGYTDRDLAPLQRGFNANVASGTVGANVPAGLTRVRIVRTWVNGNVGPADVVFDKEMDLSVHPTLTEGDLYGAGLLDLDWGTLSTSATAAGMNASLINSATYRVVIGDEEIKENRELDNCLSVMFENRFEQLANQSPTTPDPSFAQLVVAGSPTFRWKHENTIGKAYPAFMCRIYDENGTVVWESQKLPVPPRDVNGYYSWTAPVSCGMVTQKGYVLEANKSYSWAISMLDAKFTNFSRAEKKSSFKFQSSGNVCEAGYGTILAKVKYFGPLVESLSTSSAQLANMIHVQAFTSPDFTGVPVGEGYVKDVETIASPYEMTVNAYVRGLPQGTYYVRAFIDTDADFARGDWESWGYACYVGGGTYPSKYTPRPFVVAEGAKVPEAEIYIEDVDTDYDGLPDGWEFNENGDLTTDGAVTAGSFYAKANAGVAADISPYAEAGLAGISAEDFAVWPILSYLKALDGGSNVASLTAALLMNLPVTVTEADIKIVSFSMEDGIELATTTSSTVKGGASLQAVPPETLKVTWQLLYAPTLEDTFTVVDSGNVTMGGASSANVKVSLDAVKSNSAFSDKSGFFKVRVMKIGQ